MDRAEAEARGCDWAERAFWERGRPARVAVQVDRCIASGADVEARTWDDETPLHMAAGYGTPETVAVLLDAGADLEARTWDDETPFQLAQHNLDVRDNIEVRWRLVLSDKSNPNA